MVSQSNFNRLLKAAQEALKACNKLQVKMEGIWNPMSGEVASIGDILHGALADIENTARQS
jgi:hypothetical protein